MRPLIEPLRKYMSPILSAGTVCLLLGSSVILGWMLGKTSLIQVHPTFVPMQFNTALGFVLCGIVLFQIYFEINRPRMITGFFLVLLGSLTLCQYVFSIDLKIDQLLMDHYITVETFHPGRMAPNTALCFIFSGLLAFFHSDSKKKTTHHALIASTLTFTGFALSLVALIGYVTKLEAAYGWQHYTRMAIHTSLGFTTFFLGYLIGPLRKLAGLKKLAPVPVGIGFILLFTLFSQAIKLHQNRATRQSQADQLSLLESNISLKLADYQLALKRHGSRIAYKEKLDEDRWRKDAREYLSDFRAYQGIYFYHSDGSLLWSETQKEESPSSTPNNLSIRNNSALDLNETSTELKFRDSHTIEILVSIAKGGKHFGTILGLVNTKGFLSTLAQSTNLKLLPFKISHKGSTTFTSPPYVTLQDTGLETVKYEETPSHRLGDHWVITIPPTESEYPFLAEAILVIGLVIALLAALSVHFRLNQLRMLKEIYSAESQSKAILANSPLGAILVDDSGKIRYSNTSIKKLFGYSRTEIEDKSIAFLFPREKNLYQNVNIFDLIESKENQDTNSYDMIGSKKDGKTVDIEVRVSSFFQGKTQLKLFTLNDLSERKLAELEKDKLVSQLEERTKVLSFMQEETNDGWWDWSCQEDVELLSPGFWRVLGYLPQERTQPLSTRLSLMHPDDRSQYLREYTEHRESKGNTPYRQIVRYRHAKGHWISVICRGRIIEWDSSGRPLKMVGSHTDITNQVTLSQQLERSNKELEEFAYVASHDLQAPLRAITSYVNLISLRLDFTDKPEVQKWINFAIDGTLEMKRLVNDLLDYARVKRTDDAPEEVDLNELVRSIEDSIFTKEDGKLVVTTRLPVVTGNKLGLRQLFQNLLSNALKFKKENIPPVIKIDCKESIDYWSISVSDNGIGMEKQYHEKIFKVFQRLHGQEKYKGTGIGLAICKKVVELHGGRIWVESSPGKGSTFEFTISKSTSGESQEKPQQLRDSSLRNPEVLVDFLCSKRKKA